MARFRSGLPQLAGDIFITDGGLETTLIFKDGFDLPCFAAFPLLESERGLASLRRYYRDYARIAKQEGVGIVLESATWRASTSWGDQLGYTATDLDRLNRMAIDLLVELRDETGTQVPAVVISGCMGPKGDGYSVSETMSAEEARLYHGAQISTFARTEADMVTSFTMTYVEEAVGLVRAAQERAMPVAVGFTVETDGRLPSGTPLGEAIRQVDDATDEAPAYFMVNCAHPHHFEHVLADRPWASRIRAVRANASSKSHAELDAATELDDGDPVQLGQDYLVLSKRLPNFNVIGGCCGTDSRHVANACRRFRAAR